MAEILIVVLLIAIVVALASGMVFLIKDGGGRERTVRALTWRIGLSLALLVVLAAGFYFGWIEPHGLRP